MRSLLQPAHKEKQSCLEKSVTWSKVFPQCLGDDSAVQRGEENHCEFRKFQIQKKLFADD